MTPALVAAATAAPLLRPEPWSAVALQQASSPDGALHCSTAPNGCKHSARASTVSRWPTEREHARILWPCSRDGGGLSSVSAEPAALHASSGIKGKRSSLVRVPATGCTALRATSSKQSKHYHTLLAGGLWPAHTHRTRTQSSMQAASLHLVRGVEAAAASQDFRPPARFLPPDLAGVAS